MQIFLVILGFVICIAAGVSILKEWFPKFKKQFRLLIPVGIFLIIFSQCFVIIPTQYTGVKILLGQVNNTPVDNGFNWKVPFVEKIQKINNKLQDKSYFSKDKDRVWSETKNRTAIYYQDIVFSYQINPEYSSWIYANVEDYKNNLLSEGMVSSAIKSVSKKLDDADATDRSIIEPLIKESLQQAVLDKYQNSVLTVCNVTVNNIDFEDSYNQAIADKQKMQIALEQQELENQKKIAEEQANAEALEIKTTAEANAIKMKAEAEAEANRLLQNSLSDMVLQFKLADKWNGTAPQYVGGEGSLFSFLIGDTNDSSSQPLSPVESENSTETSSSEE